MIFHMGYAMAVALKRGKVSPSDLEGESLHDPELVRFAKATRVEADPELTAIYHEKKPCDVTFHLKDGESHFTSASNTAGAIRKTGPPRRRSSRNSVISRHPCLYGGVRTPSSIS